MKKHTLLALLMLIAGLCSLSSTSQALIELRGGYGAFLPKEEQVESTFKVSTFTGFHGDLIVTPPLFPLGFGIRYEQSNSKSTGLPIINSTEYSNQRTAFILNGRIIDTVMFLGFIGTAGLTQEVNMKVDGVQSAKFNTGRTYTLGAEAGVHLLGFLVGAELGYQFGSLEDRSKAITIKMDGTYGKVHVGFSF